MKIRGYKFPKIVIQEHFSYFICTHSNKKYQHKFKWSSTKAFHIINNYIFHKSVDRIPIHKFILLETKIFLNKIDELKL